MSTTNTTNTSNTNTNTSLEIQTILEKNRLDDLKRFLSTRQCLNATNTRLIYLFHFFQSAGILTTSFAAGNNNFTLIWLGVALNFLASLISIYEKTNSSMLKKLMNDIKLIKEGNYIDEGELIDVDDDLNKPNNNNVTTNKKGLNQEATLPLLGNATNNPLTTYSSYQSIDNVKTNAKSIDV